ncbi:MAG: hypothetical protein ACOCVS_03665 [Planctomycetota bacterium]
MDVHLLRSDSAQDEVDPSGERVSTCLAALRPNDRIRLEYRHSTRFGWSVAALDYTAPDGKLEYLKFQEQEDRAPIFRGQRTGVDPDAAEASFLRLLAADIEGLDRAQWDDRTAVRTEEDRA